MSDSTDFSFNMFKHFHVNVNKCNAIIHTKTAVVPVQRTLHTKTNNSKADTIHKQYKNETNTFPGRKKAENNS